MLFLVGLVRYHFLLARLHIHISRFACALLCLWQVYRCFGEIQNLVVTDGYLVYAYSSFAGGSFLILYVFQDAPDQRNCLSTQRFIISIRLYGDDFYMLDYGTICLTASKARLRQRLL